ncbi:MAG: Mov34/MPN/PAD-1 family protein [archaeon]
MAAPQITAEIKKEVIEKEPPKDSVLFIYSEKKGSSTYITSDVLEKMIKHAEKGGKNEIMGLLLCDAKYKWKNQEYVIINDTVTSELEANAINVKFKGFEEMFEKLDRLHKSGKDVLRAGWYHSHPGHGCWLSPTDMATINTMFREKHQVSIVVDPHRKHIGVFKPNNPGGNAEGWKEVNFAIVPGKKYDDLKRDLKRIVYTHVDRKILLTAYGDKKLIFKGDVKNKEPEPVKGGIPVLNVTKKEQKEDLIIDMGREFVNKILNGTIKLKENALAREEIAHYKKMLEIQAKSKWREEKTITDYTVSIVRNFFEREEVKVAVEQIEVKEFLDENKIIEVGKAAGLDIKEMGLKILINITKYISIGDREKIVKELQGNETRVRGIIDTFNGFLKEYAEAKTREDIKKYFVLMHLWTYQIVAACIANLKKKRRGIRIIRKD